MSQTREQHLVANFELIVTKIKADIRKECSNILEKKITSLKKEAQLIATDKKYSQIIDQLIETEKAFRPFKNYILGTLKFYCNLGSAKDDIYRSLLDTNKLVKNLSEEDELEGDQLDEIYDNFESAVADFEKDPSKQYELEALYIYVVSNILDTAKKIMQLDLTEFEETLFDLCNLALGYIETLESLKAKISHVDTLSAEKKELEKLIEPLKPKFHPTVEVSDYAEDGESFDQKSASASSNDEKRSESKKKKNKKKKAKQKARKKQNSNNNNNNNTSKTSTATTTTTTTVTASSHQDQQLQQLAVVEVRNYVKEIDSVKEAESRRNKITEAYYATNKLANNAEQLDEFYLEKGIIDFKYHLEVNKSQSLGYKIWLKAEEERDMKSAAYSYEEAIGIFSKDPNCKWQMSSIYKEFISRLEIFIDKINDLSKADKIQDCNDQIGLIKLTFSFIDDVEVLQQKNLAHPDHIKTIEKIKDKLIARSDFLLTRYDALQRKKRAAEKAQRQKEIAYTSTGVLVKAKLEAGEAQTKKINEEKLAAKAAKNNNKNKDKKEMSVGESTDVTGIPEADELKLIVVKFKTETMKKDIVSLKKLKKQIKTGTIREKINAHLLSIDYALQRYTLIKKTEYLDAAQESLDQINKLAQESLSQATDSAKPNPELDAALRQEISQRSAAIKRQVDVRSHTANNKFAVWKMRREKKMAEMGSAWKAGKKKVSKTAERYQEIKKEAEVAKEKSDKMQETQIALVITFMKELRLEEGIHNKKSAMIDEADRNALEALQEVKVAKTGLFCHTRRKSFNDRKIESEIYSNDNNATSSKDTHMQLFKHKRTKSLEEIKQEKFELVK